LSQYIVFSPGGKAGRIFKLLNAQLKYVKAGGRLAMFDVGFPLQLRYASVSGRI
jgi:hypothetical protein